MKRNQDVSLGRQLKTTYPKSLLLIHVDLVDYCAQLRHTVRPTLRAAGSSGSISPISPAPRAPISPSFHDFAFIHINTYT